ncbi:MAG: transcriptional activator NhaR [Acidobacteria bacterium]|nr:transcriptional activator NhaR [Acidobacteriota bacterium]
MEWLNYHHLLYLHTVVRAGSIAKASQQLRVSSPAISAQLRSLEESLGEKLLERSGRNLVLTEMGRVVFSYAEDIFSLGQELVDTVRNRPTGRPMRLDIGIVDVMPKLIAKWLIDPALRLSNPVRIVCREGTSEQLISHLATLELDLVLSDTPLNPNLKVRAYNHLLGETGITFVAHPKLAARCKGKFPACLDTAPMLLPTENTDLRRNLDVWFERSGIRPDIVGEFEDHALLRAFGQSGYGVFPVPSVFESHLKKQEGLRRIGRTNQIRSRFYAISAERKLKHPAVVAICDAARKELFDRS